MLTVKNLTYSFKKEGMILSSLDLELGKGRIYGLLGLNGAGKTTLLNNITGALFPDSGACLLNGADIRNRAPRLLSQLYMVPEQFDIPKLTGEQYISLHRGFYPNFSNELLKRVLDDFEVNSSKKLSSLSFGQQKKFMIAFAIATQTPLLLLDEPTNGLDIPSKSQFRKTMASLDTESRCIVISTHQVRDLGSMIDHLLVLKGGKIVFNRSLEEISNELSIRTLDNNSTADYLYGEESLGGIQAITPNTDHKSEQLDLELLFNGIIENTEAINNQFREAI